MQVLQWAIDHPGEIERGVLVCASARLTAQNIAFSAVARASIMADEHFAGGDYYETGARPDVGLAVARMLAHITYVSEELVGQKFGRSRRSDRPTFDDRLRGRELPRPPGRELPRALRREHLPLPDPRHGLLRPVRGRGEPRCARLRSLRCTRTSSSSRSTPTGASRRQATDSIVALDAAGGDASCTEIASPHGHDSFLLPVPAYHEAVRSSSKRSRVCRRLPDEHAPRAIGPEVVGTSRVDAELDRLPSRRERSDSARTSPAAHRSRSRACGTSAQMPDSVRWSFGSEIGCPSGVCAPTTIRFPWRETCESAGRKMMAACWSEAIKSNLSGLATCVKHHGANA